MLNHEKPISVLMMMMMDSQFSLECGTGMSNRASTHAAPPVYSIVKPHHYAARLEDLSLGAKKDRCIVFSFVCVCGSCGDRKGWDTVKGYVHCRH